ncbi:hypothetical protein LSH36_32g22005 [Paralvinella palmiformis]|uniref:Uncharacterized protein n=1 Tax=Paralvinella palmiformis TaxID=53620 RepID=A0AAD9NEK3_9ANNE|nr:hypothetical protein LSH36_32g22005 [Paralvinella palmiformis]
MCGDPTIRTWNGVYTMLRSTGKYLMARFDDGSRNPCKFQIRCVVSDDYKGDKDKAPFYVDWCGIGIHQHASKKPDESNGPQTPNSKFFRRYMFGQRLDYFGVSGTGIKPWKAKYETISNPLYFPRTGENLDQLPWAKKGGKKRKVPYPACHESGTPTYAIYVDPAEKAIKFRSYCCGWAVDFWPDGRNTCVNVYADMNNDFIKNTAADSMEGLCGGKINGSRKEDWSTCGIPRTPLTANEDASMTAMEQSCHEGDHNGSGYPGGTRLDAPGH